MSNAKPKMGRPTLFTDELALEICERIANGRSLRSVCLDKDMPHMATVMRWLDAKQRILRAGLKDPAKEVEDLQKAAWYIQDEIKRIKGDA